MRLARIHPRRSHFNREQGYVLLLMLFLAAMLIIAMTASVPYLTTQIKRDREIEMIHRGEQYARAVKRYYRKFGRYPGRIEDLEKTNNIRFLRKRYKDPMTPDGNWRLVRFGEVQLGGAPNIAGATPVSNMGSSFGGGSSFGSGSFGSSTQNQGAANQSPTGTSSFGSSSFGSSTSDSGTPNSGTTAQSSSLFGQQIAGGGGAILGVASLSKKNGIHEFNKKSAYKDWLFIYDATRDKGQLIKGPYNPNAFVGQFNNALGSQASGGIGQPIAGPQSGFGNNPSNFGSGMSSPQPQPTQPQNPR